MLFLHGVDALRASKPRGFIFCSVFPLELLHQPRLGQVPKSRASIIATDRPAARIAAFTAIPTLPSPRITASYFSTVPAYRDSMQFDPRFGAVRQDSDDRIPHGLEGPVHRLEMHLVERMIHQPGKQTLDLQSAHQAAKGAVVGQ